MCDFVDPIWEARGKHASKCSFCGKEGQYKFYAPHSKKHYACDCPAFIAYKKLYDECLNKLNEFSAPARLRKKIWDKEVELIEKNDEIKKMSEDLDFKKYDTIHIERDIKELQEVLVQCEKIQRD